MGVVATGAVGPATASGQTAGYPACRTSQLAVWAGVPGSGTAGSTYYQLEFSNISTTTCSLFGFPGVSAVTATGRQLGSAASRDRVFAPATVVLSRGATAHAVLRVTNVSVYPSAACQPATSTALKIYPPNQRTAVNVPFRLRACAKLGPVYLSVRTVRPLTGVPGYSQ